MCPLFFLRSLLGARRSSISPCRLSQKSLRKLTRSNLLLDSKVANSRITLSYKMLLLISRCRKRWFGGLDLRTTGSKVLILGGVTWYRALRLPSSKGANYPDRRGDVRGFESIGQGNGYIVNRSTIDTCTNYSINKSYMLTGRMSCFPFFFNVLQPRVLGAWQST